MTNEQFYEACARILNTEALGNRFSHYKRTRWNNRKPGQGRFAGRGIIRCFGEQVHVALSKPTISKVFASKQQALDWLQNNS